MKSIHTVTVVAVSKATYFLCMAGILAGRHAATCLQAGNRLAAVVDDSIGNQQTRAVPGQGVCASPTKQGILCHQESVAACCCWTDIAGLSMRWSACRSDVLSAESHGGRPLRADQVIDCAVRKTCSQAFPMPG